MVSTTLQDARLNRDARITRLRLVADKQAGKARHEDIAVIGLGYVGLPLAVRLAHSFERVAGFDISARRVDQINDGYDATNEIDPLTLRGSGLTASTACADIADASFYIVTVPTPIDDARKPDLGPLVSSCEVVGPCLKAGDIVVFESTVYPGATEEICVPILERLSGLRMGVDFGIGYSPERINPGDKVNTVTNVVKVISGDSPDTLARVRAVYETVIDAGLHAAPSIKVAEAAKVLENTQRDVNIALMNEMSLICDKIGINTHDVIDAAATKWNFVRMTPGLVGGHCIGVDPYYLAALAERIGHNPQVIMAGRRTNEMMVRHVADAALRLLIQQGGEIVGKRVGVCGVTFKEDVPDLRNSKTLELIEVLRGYGLDPIVHDPHCDARDAANHGIKLTRNENFTDLDMMILATAHREYIEDKGFVGRIRDGGALMDVKAVLRKVPMPENLTYWSL
ncbi:nucleotide sugar dehydrogenase [Maliponia aquimaris]|uniref:UDP-N-acetyl-D-glucosamine 6-dehydrogenase n=1 Tax=Maliponia aquimaris TaxID=1673631 RepID=A0A238K207_9RHOB|nr:nucleotide sugar dehydrogenase [Maliponia aquimaris]SMX36487.1 UDP-N-acetyl-D-glucosamine 6-dehydrogenase [Maliponia aquimaris]